MAVGSRGLRERLRSRPTSGGLLDPDPSLDARSDPPSILDRDSVRYVLLGAIVLLGYYLRFRDPLSSPVIGAEDPYMHMSRTWTLLETGELFNPKYPPGFYLLLAPFALMGPDAFYQVARLGPPLVGGLAVPAVYLLCREHLSEAGAMTGAFLVAIMPEHIRRTDLLFPTLLDLVLVPFLLIHLLRAADGSRRSMWIATGIGAFLLLVHPWVLGLVLPVALVFLGLQAMLDEETSTQPVAWAAAGGLVLALMVLFVPGTYNPARNLTATAPQRLAELASDPGTLTPLPKYVDPPWMLTLPGLTLAGAGALTGLLVPRLRSRFTLLAIVWVGLLFPIVLVNWFGVWFIPHRTAVYLSVGIAMLAGVAVDAMAVPLGSRGLSWAPAAVLGLTVLTAGTVALPHATGEGDWQRHFEPEDMDAWRSLEQRDPERVEMASWRTRTAYEAVTGEPAHRSTGFWWDNDTRENYLSRHPNVHVVVDDLTREEDAPTGFLDGDDWEQIGRWGNTTVHRHTGTSG